MAPAADISISAEISNTSIAFDQKDTLKVSLTWEGEPFTYQIDDFPMPVLEKLQILGSSTAVSSHPDSTAEGGSVTTRTYRYILEPSDYGTGVIEPMNLTASYQLSGETHQLLTGRLAVVIARPALDETDDKGGSAMLLILIALLVVFGGGVVVYLVIRRRQKGTPKIVVNGHYVEALQAIRKEAVADRKLFYSRLYRLLLNFLERERGLDVAGKTGEEIILAVGALNDEGERDRIIQWLKQAQKIKYQPESPSPGDVENSFNEICSFFEDKQHDK
jgi:hypothetical protein